MSVEHKVAIHQLAAKRRAAGLPVWKYTVRGFKAALEAHEDDLIATIGKLVAILKSSKWYKKSEEYGDLWDLIDELSDIDNPDIDWDLNYNPERHFNAVLGAIYDLADWERVWLE